MLWCTIAIIYTYIRTTLGISLEHEQNKLRPLQPQQRKNKVHSCKTPVLFSFFMQDVSKWSHSWPYSNNT